MTELGNWADRNIGWLRLAAWGAVAALILTPLVAMRLAPDLGFNWTAGDFVFATLMLGGVGLLFELAVRTRGSWAFRGGAALALLAGLLLVWSSLAVGYVGDGSAPINLVLLALPAVALAASLVVRFDASRMAMVMAGAAAVHGAAGIAGMMIEPVTGPITAAFVALWLGSAALFRKAGRERLAA